jgi:filamentous hemagglutinin family protein
VCSLTCRGAVYPAALENKKSDGGVVVCTLPAYQSKKCGHAAVLLRGSIALLFGGVLSTANAQVVTDITSDGTLGTTVTPSGNVYNIDGGTINGANQFHSFAQFSVGTGDIASFNGPVGIQNILSRVTGGNISEIDGTLGSTISGANLFLMNPSGILLGPNAQLDLTGSFHATTADRIRFDDVAGTLFNAVASGADGALDPVANPLLATASPAAFGFLTANAATIDVRTGVFDFDAFFQTGNPGDGYTNILQVPTGQTLSFIGGSVNVGSGFPPEGFVFVPGGHVNVVSTASPGEASFNGDGSIDVSDFTRLGQINIKGNSFIDAKDVYIRGGQLSIEDATIFPGLLFLAGLPSPAPDGGSVDIGVTNEVTITATGGPFLNGPGIQTFAGSPGGLVPGDVPAIHIDANSVSMSGEGAIISSARLGPENVNSPDITINAQTITVENGSSINLLNFFEGSGGALTLNADTITLANDVDAVSFTGVLAQSFFHPGYGFVFFPFLADADSGSIAINSNNLTVRGRAEITSDSFAFGNSGVITINTHDANFTGAGSISSASVLAGTSADITISATGQIEMEDGFRITGATGGSGDAGTVSVTAGQSINMAGTNTRITTITIQPPDDDRDLTDFARLFDGVFQANLGIPIPDYPALREALGIAPHNGDLMDVLAALNGLGLTAVADLTEGDAGTISVTTPTLSMSGDTRIETSTGWDGNAGAVETNIGSLFINNGATIRSLSGTQRPTGEFVVGTGNAGSVSLTASDIISISGRSQTSGVGSTVSTSTFGDGSGGSVELNASQVQILNGGIVSADSGGTIAGQEFAGTGLTGNITITGGTDIVLNGGTISTRAVTSDGGNIKLTAPNIVQLTGSQITTSVESGEGGGGNINIDPEFIVLNKSQITANALGGPGGNITLIANNFVPSADSLVQASSALSTQGTIVIASPENNIAGSIAQLPQEIVDVSGLLPERCAARGAGGAQNSFVVAGRGGLPTNPDNYLPSFGAGSVPLKSAGGPLPSGTTEAALTSARDIAVAMAAWNCVPGSERRVKVQEVISQLF